MTFAITQGWRIAVTAFKEFEKVKITTGKTKFWSYYHDEGETKWEQERIYEKNKRVYSK